MKTLNHKLKKHDTGLADSDTGRAIKTLKAVDLTKECGGKPTFLLYAKARRGPLVQIKQGCSSVHYFLWEIHRELQRDSVLQNVASYCKMPMTDLIQLIQTHAP